PKALAIDQIGFRRKADQMQLVSAKQNFGRQKRTVRRAHDQNFVGRRHNAPPRNEMNRYRKAHDRQADRRRSLLFHECYWPRGGDAMQAAALGAAAFRACSIDVRRRYRHRRRNRSASAPVRGRALQEPRAWAPSGASERLCAQTSSWSTFSPTPSRFSASYGPERPSSSFWWTVS